MKDGFATKKKLGETLTALSLPGLPNVDSHVARDDLKYERMREKIRKERWHAAKKEIEEKESLMSVIASDEKSDSSESTVKEGDEIHRACRYIDKTFGNGDGEISQQELEKVFRVMRRQGAQRNLRERGRALVRRLNVLMDRRGLSFDDLVKYLDVSCGGAGDGKITRHELKSGLAKLATEDHNAMKFGEDGFLATDVASKMHSTAMKRRDKADAKVLMALEAAEHEVDPELEQQFQRNKKNAAAAANARGVTTFSDRDVSELLRFLDPDADGDLTLTELRAGFTRAMLPAAQNVANDAALAIMEKFEMEMKKKNLRIADLFRIADRDGSGSISFFKMGKMMQNLCPGNKEQLAKIQKRKDALAKKTKKELELQLERELRRKQAEAAGAPQALTRLDALLRQGGYRVSDLFSKAGFDASGDGKLDAVELQAALAASGLKLRRAEVAALVQYIDESGDGEIDGPELHAALRRNRRDFGSDEKRRLLNAKRRARKFSMFGLPHHRGLGAAASASSASLAALLSTSSKLCDNKKKSSYAHGAIDKEFDSAWLKSLDIFLARHSQAVRELREQEALRNQAERLGTAHSSTASSDTPSVLAD